jgi:thiamine kinase-like enzyme
VLLKLDAGTHGDNHFFPGPCDIAWDVAGTIVEWELQGNARKHFVGEYTRRSGDRIAERLHPYLLAYATFRMGWSSMAVAAMQGECDEMLLTRDYRRYRAQAQLLRLRSGAAQPA